MQQNLGDFGLFHIAQVGFVVKNLDEKLKNFQDLVQPAGNLRLAEFDHADIMLHGKKGICNAKLAFIDTGDIQIEYIEPGEGESIYSEFINEKGEGMHHLAAFVDDLNKEALRFSSRGI